MISSNNFKFEIFDCGDSLYFEKEHKVQMESTTQVIKLLENSNKVDCKASNYKIDNLAEGLVLDTLNGELTVNTSKPINQTGI